MGALKRSNFYLTHNKYLPRAFVWIKTMQKAPVEPLNHLHFHSQPTSSCVFSPLLRRLKQSSDISLLSMTLSLPVSPIRIHSLVCCKQISHWILWFPFQFPFLSITVCNGSSLCRTSSHADAGEWPWASVSGISLPCFWSLSSHLFSLFPAPPPPSHWSWHFHAWRNRVKQHRPPRSWLIIVIHTL